MELKTNIALGAKTWSPYDHCFNSSLVSLDGVGSVQNFGRQDELNHNLRQLRFESCVT
jgi:hypothetical protein